VARFLRAFGGFLGLQACLLALLLLLEGPPQTYLAASLDKSRLLAEAPSPRVLLVGGSNLAFGIESGVLKKGLDNRYSPVNLGLHAGAGLGFELNQALAGIRSGDIVVLSPEYDTLWYEKRDLYTLCELVRLNPSAWNYVPAGQRAWLVRGLLDHPAAVANTAAVIAWGQFRGAVSGRRVSPAEKVYSRSSFNRYGDIAGARSLPTQYKSKVGNAKSTRSIESGLRESSETLSGFIKDAKLKGATVVYAFPPLPVEVYRADRRDIQATSEVLRRRLDVDFMGSPAEVTYPSSQFFDTQDHLRGGAVEDRTLDLVRELRVALGLRPRARSGE
jgi:hypothetical protein